MLRDEKGRFVKGRIVPKEWNEQHSERMSGENHPLFGKHHSIKTKQKMSLAVLGEKSYLFGKHLSEGIKEKIRLNHDDRHGEKNTMFGKTGEKSSNWKGGITPINSAIRASLTYREWRKEVFERDGYTCKKCNAKNGNGKTINLNSHHIKSFAKYPELRFEVSNGLALCEDCHEKTFKKY